MNENVLEKIVASKKLPVLFIGSGISKRYLHNYPTWDELIELSFKKYNSDLFQLQKHKDAMLREGLSPFEINTSLATIIENDFNAAFFDRKIKLNIGNSKNPAWVHKGISPYKMFLSLYFKKMKIQRSQRLLDELEKFRSLKAKISAVITTNYDLFLENEIFSNDFTVFVNQHQLFDSDSYNISEIYKIHGSATDATSLIVTKADYEKFQDSRKLIIAKMLTLFAESPIIFLGYSFSDENIQLIISDFLSCLSAEQRSTIREHFVFISYRKGEMDLIEIKRNITTKNGAEIPITEIQTDNYARVFDILNKIVPGVSPLKIRETRRIIKTIVDSSISDSNAEATIVGLDDLSKMDLSGKPLAIAIGYRENILSKFGYGIFDDDVILEDILYDNKHLDPDAMCLDRFKSIAATRLLPVFKYIRQARISVSPNSRLGIYVTKHNSVDKIISKNVAKTLKNIPEIHDYLALITEIESKPDLNKKAGVLLKNIEHFSISQVRDICKMLFAPNRDTVKSATHFKRCVMYIDLMENWA
ncbi:MULTISPECIES: SIR2 family protein [unclassified Candidatus Paralachnospira]|uniref:SIR2 family protein n=1 Tax=unclassified Candidatus Paralachnospira TaxID=3099471 RepID=UPI003F9238A7